MASVGTTPISLTRGPVLIQNLGPDFVYVGQSTVVDSPTVTVDNGFRLSAGETLSVGTTNTKISVVSVGDSDIRTLSSGTGVYSTPNPTPVEPPSTEEPA